MLDFISLCGRCRGLMYVSRCPIDLKFDREPIGVILRWSISSDLDAMVPGSFAASRLDFASEHQTWSNVVGMTWKLTCSPLEACRSYSCVSFDEWWHQRFSPLGGLISPFESWWRVKRCRFDLKFDVEPFGSILRPSIGSNCRFDIFDTVAAGSSRLTVGGLTLSQMVSKWPETSCVSLFSLFWKILQFFFDFDKIWCLKQLCLFVVGCDSM